MKTESFLAGFVVYGVEKELRFAAANHLHQNGHWLLYAVFALMFKKIIIICPRNTLYTHTRAHYEARILQPSGNMRACKALWISL